MTLFPVIDHTWPAAKTWRDGPFELRDGQGGGKRVSAASLINDVWSPDDVRHAETEMIALNQMPLFMIRSKDHSLDAHLAANGYDIVDPVNLYSAPAQVIACERPPKVSMFAVWPPLAIQQDIWEHAGIGSARWAVMDRAKGPKTSILIRWNDKAAGTAFVACHGTTAMVHAVEIEKPHQRQGVGRHFMNFAAFWAMEQGMTHIATLCVKTNVPANGLYSSLGMQVVDNYQYRIKRT